MLRKWKEGLTVKSNKSKLSKLQTKLKTLQAAQRVDDRKWQMRIELIESEIKRIVKEEKA